MLPVVAGAVLAGCASAAAATTSAPQSCPARSKQLDRPSFDHPLASARTYPTPAAASRRLSFKPVVPRALGVAVRVDGNQAAIALVYGATCTRRFVVIEAASPKVPNGGLAGARRIANGVGSTIAWNQDGITFTVSGPAPSFTMRKAERVARVLAGHA